ncbi:phage integrase family protein with SAM-like domain [Couchioplanes caeruleus]|uniref:Phage integrase family protein with SAM-like domain n=1 Tax=Couchioplanes caeruleus TaxID=56438 RepID=A0A3N1FTD1_9ACTN|nr:phage integrase family protein with SAM-like domain [Couchioplanes caeruleus]
MRPRNAADSPSHPGTGIAAAVAALPLPVGEPGTRWSPHTVTAAWLAARRSPHTRRAYFRDLADYLAWTDRHGLDPRQARSGDVDLYLASLREQTPAPSPATLRRRLAALPSWYAYLTEHDLTERNPVATVDRPPVDRDHSSTVGLTVAEVQALLGAAAADRSGAALPWQPRYAVAARNRVLIALLATLGPRVGEAIALDLTHLRHHDGHRALTVPGKGGRLRELPIPPALGRDLDAYLRARRLSRPGALSSLYRKLDDHQRGLEEAIADHIASTAARGVPPTPDAWERRALGYWRHLMNLRKQVHATLMHDAPLAPELLVQLPPLTPGPLLVTSGGARLRQAYAFALVRRLARAAQLSAAEHLSPHSLRHAAATAALNDGATLRDVQGFLGHADPRTTRRYDRHLAVLHAD